MKEAAQDAARRMLGKILGDLRSQLTPNGP